MFAFYKRKLNIMKTPQLITQFFFWSARITGAAVLAFVLFFILAHAFGDEPGNGNPLTNIEIMSVIFGISSLIGLAIAFFKSGIGGLISVLGMLGFFIVRSDLLSQPGLLGLFIIPGFLFIISHLLSQKKLKIIE